mmetsp:Transcript_50248/g.151274  ORF Transcript_50248/g.151274 Transcript_50248/m.151274 type:complete len:116 (+) Transcript_50248:86-433(+)
MGMDCVLGQVAFLYAFNQVKPAVIIDKVIDFALDILVPGKRVGDSNWWSHGWKMIEQHADRTSKELDIRGDLRRWDEEFPFFSHELIIRYAAGFFASTIVMTVYNELRGGRMRKR